MPSVCHSPPNKLALRVAGEFGHAFAFGGASQLLAGRRGHSEHRAVELRRHYFPPEHTRDQLGLAAREMTVRALKAGAVDFLTKPFRDQDMLDAVSKAIEHDRKRRKDHKAMLDLRALFDSLTPREQEVLALVAGGLLNKQIAAEIGLAEITVKIHRGHLMKKMGAKSLADLVRMAENLGVRRTKP
jgi:DNA-binding CsgD family transcriptional regulator